MRAITTKLSLMKVGNLAEIPLPMGLEGSAQLPFTRKALRNCWNTGGESPRIIQRPGIDLLNTNSRVARGAFEWNGGLYVVASTDLLKITNVLTGAFSVIGTIVGSEPVVTAIGFNTAVIAVKGGGIYTLDSSDTLVDISGNANMQSIRSITHINGRFVYIPSDGSPAFFSDVGAAGTVQALSFFDAEQLPDNNTEVFQVNNILYIAGSDSIQSYLDRGLSPVPYVPQTGRIDNGIIGGVVEVSGSQVFIGREKGQDLGIYALSPNVATKISNEFIDNILAGYTEAELAQSIGGRYKYKGYDIIHMSLIRDSFGFYQGNWHGTDTMVDGSNVPWQVGYVKEYQLKYYSFYANNISVLSNVNKDAGNPFLRIIDFGYEQDGSFNVQSLNYHISQGYNSNIGSVFLQTSDDNVLYGEPFAASTGSIGQYATELDWNYPGGLGLYDRFMGIRLQTGEDINFSGTKAYIQTR